MRKNLTFSSVLGILIEIYLKKLDTLHYELS